VLPAQAMRLVPREEVESGVIEAEGHPSPSQNWNVLRTDAVLVEEVKGSLE